IGHTTGGVQGTGLEGFFQQHPFAAQHPLAAAQFASQHPLVAAAMLRPYFQGGLGHTTGRVHGAGLEGFFQQYPSAAQHPSAAAQFASQHPLVPAALLRPYVGGIGHTTGVPGIGVGMGGIEQLWSQYGQNPIGQYGQYSQYGQNPIGQYGGVGAMG